VYCFEGETRCPHDFFMLILAFSSCMQWRTLFCIVVQYRSIRFGGEVYSMNFFAHERPSGWKEKFLEKDKLVVSCFLFLGSGFSTVVEARAWICGRKRSALFFSCCGCSCSVVRFCRFCFFFFLLSNFSAVYLHSQKQKKTLLFFVVGVGLFDK